MIATAPTLLGLLPPTGPAPLRPSALADVVLALARYGPDWIGRPGDHPGRRSGLCLLATPGHDAWLLRWPAGTGVSPHDHGGSRGAFTVLSGQLIERRWQGGVPADRVVGAGEVVTVGSSVVHDVFCVGAGPAVSVHAYSPPLSSMGFYDESGTTLLDRQLVGTEAGPSATARALHPAGGR